MMHRQASASRTRAGKNFELSGAEPQKQIPLIITGQARTFFSRAFVPLDVLPAWMRLLAGINPMTCAIDAMRALIPCGRDAHGLVLMGIVLLAFNGVMFRLGAGVLNRQLA